MKEKKAGIKLRLIIFSEAQVMDPSIIKTEVWNAQGSSFALCSSDEQRSIYRIIFVSSHGPKNQAEGWRFGDTLIMIPDLKNFPEFMT